MTYRLLADGVLVLHLAFIVYAVLGGLSAVHQFVRIEFVHVIGVERFVRFYKNFNIL